MIISGSNGILPREFMHRHRLHKMTDNQTMTDQCETHYIIEQLAPIVEGNLTGLEVKKFVKEKIHSTWDNLSLVM